MKMKNMRSTTQTILQLYLLFFNTHLAYEDTEPRLKKVIVYLGVRIKNEKHFDARFFVALSCMSHGARY
jgi:hypothetical protein